MHTFIGLSEGWIKLLLRNLIGILGGADPLLRLI